MNKKSILTIILVVIIVVVGLFFFLDVGGKELNSMDSSISIPNSYFINDQGIAYSDNIGIFFIGVTNSKNFLDDYFEALKVNGKSSGYKNITTEEVNGYKLYEYNGNIKELKNVSSIKTNNGNYLEWKEYEPDTSFINYTNMNVVKFRQITYFNEKTDSLNQLFIFTNDTNVDLYSDKLNNIAHSIKPLNS